MVEFENLLCLVNDYAYAKCRNCVDLCYKNAFVFDGIKIVFDSELCTGCGACVGGCPTEAIELSGFNASEFAIINEKSVIGCGANLPCLAVFCAEHFVVMGQQRALSCDLSECKSCDVASKALDPILSRIDEANNLLRQLDLTPITVSYTKSQNSRREFFAALLSSTKKMVQHQPQKMVRVDFNTTPTPKHKIIFQNRLRGVELDLISPLFPTRSIGNSCTACSECVRICPTKSLYWMGESLVINSSKCVDCGFCEQVCKYDAIYSPQELHAKSYVNGDITTLKEFRFVECDRCATPFPQQHDESTCPQCKEYYENFTDMFVPEYRLSGR